MGTTTTVPTESKSRLVGSEQVKHTPGPWRLADNDETIVVTEILDNEGNCVVIADTLTVEGGARPQDFSNARLIAAAPDMLAALRQAEIVLRFLAERLGKEEREVHPQVLAAIAKAEGRTP